MRLFTRHYRSRFDFPGWSREKGDGTGDFAFGLAFDGKISLLINYYEVRDNISPCS